MLGQKLGSSTSFNISIGENLGPHRAEETLHVCLTVVAQNPASFDYSLVEKSLVAWRLYANDIKGQHKLSKCCQ